MIGKVFERMEVLFPSATKSEQKLIEEIKKSDKESLIYLSITELSDATGVAEATISRFCRKLNYRSFQDFKLALGRETDIPRSASDRPSEKCGRMTEAIAETCKSTDYNLHLQIAREIVNAKKVCVFGVGNSSVASLALRFRLLRAGINADSSNDPHVQIMAAANLGKEDILILVSVSGSTKDMLEIAMLAKNAGARIAVITNHSKSPLAKYADYLLLSSRKEAPHDHGSLATIVAQIYVADVLCAAVYDVMGSDGEEKRKNVCDAVADKAI